MAVALRRKEIKSIFELISIQSNKGTPLSTMHQLYENENFSVNYRWLQFDSAALLTTFPPYNRTKYTKTKKVRLMAPTMTHLPLPQHILELIRSGAAANRADLARLLGRAPSTISLHVSELLEQGLLEEAGETNSTGGRKGRRLQLPSSSGYFLVADIGTEILRYGITDTDGRFLETRTTALPTEAKAEEHFDILVSSFTELLKAHSSTSPLRVICIGLPAPIDHRRGCVHSSARVPRWNDFPIVSRLENLFHAPCLIENDVNLQALAENHHHGIHADSITLKAGNGSGIGIVMNEKIHRGSTGAAGDISHVRHHSYGSIKCACGNTGCLATVVSTYALTQLWKESGEEATFDALFTAAQQSDPRAIHIFRQAGEHLGTALCTVVSFFNPGAVYLAGPLAQIDVYVSAIRTSIYGGCHPLVTRELTVERALLGEDGELNGAAVLAKLHFSEQ